MLAHVHLAEALEEGQDGQVQPLAGALCIPLLVQACVNDGQQAKNPGPQVPIQQLLQSLRPRCFASCRTMTASRSCGLRSNASMHKRRVACWNQKLLSSVRLWIRSEADVPGSLRWCCYY